MKRAIELAVRRPADAILFVCDSDDDCPAHWGPPTKQLISAQRIGGAVMIVREYEAWLLCSESASKTLGNRPIDQIRDAKGRLKEVVQDYKPTVHQVELTRKIAVEQLRTHSDSFDKFVRTLADIYGVSCGARKA